MLYFFLKPLVQLAIKVYFRNIFLSGLNNLPHNKPYLIAMNHPSAFLEPVIMASNINKPIHFLARGDHFNKRFYRFLLNQAKMVPVFRQKESGFGSLKNNYDTFFRCYEYIAKGELVALFPEGRTEHEKRLRPLQRGVARIAFGTLTHFPHLDDLYIVPVGASYADALSFRTTAVLHIGEPMSVRNYFGDGKSPDHQSLLLALEARLKEYMVIIDKVEDEELIETCLTMARNTRNYSFFKVYQFDSSLLYMERKVVGFWNKEASDSLKDSTKRKVTAYLDLLAKSKLSDKVISLQIKSCWVSFFPIFHLTSSIGNIFVFPMTYFADWVEKNKIKHLSFKSPVRFGAAFGVSLLYLIITIILSAYLSILVLPLVLLLGLMAYFSLYFREKQAISTGHSRFLKLNEAQKEKLLTLKKDILDTFIFKLSE
jgi:glycerol-3-phosphate O-acyltransferase/dihydroxyacetone phosphate acyltransferase